MIKPKGRLIGTWVHDVEFSGDDLCVLYHGGELYLTDSRLQEVRGTSRAGNGQCGYGEINEWITVKDISLDNFPLVAQRYGLAGENLRDAGRAVFAVRE